MPKYLALLFLIFPVTALAAPKPSAQISIGDGQILRGQFSEVRELKGSSTPFVSSGHFVVAPAQGLIWEMEKPMATSTIITPALAMQDIGGFALKLPAKNLRHLFDMVGNAIRGDWTELERDFVMTLDDRTNHWTMILTPNENAKTAYASIFVSGGRFVENIVMTKNDRTHDSFSFVNPSLTPAQLTADESALFREAGQP